MENNTGTRYVQRYWPVVKGNSLSGPVRVISNGGFGSFVQIHTPTVGCNVVGL
jgi:hypothetical protein